MIWITLIFSFYVVLDISTTTTTMNPTPMATTTTTKDYNLVSLNGSRDSALEVDEVLDLNGPFSLGFRICKGTSGLLRQTSSVGDVFELFFIDRNIVLNYTNQSSNQNVTLATGIKLESWHTLHWNTKREDGMVEFDVVNEMTRQSVILDSTFKQINLTHGSKLLVGQDLTGCLSSGDKISLVPFSTGTCFLDYEGCPEERLTCEDIHCDNGGTCHEGDPSYCICAPGFTGALCNSSIEGGGWDELCPSSSCQNGGTCVKEANGTSSCSCVREIIDHSNFTKDNTTYDVGFSGEYCETWIDACSMTPPICIEGACKKDTSRPLGFKCFCPQGADFRVGEYCQYRTDICKVGSKCLNGGTCTSLGGEKFRCSCEPGYKGKNCEVDINECLSSPCMNEGVCEDGINSYNCSCSEGTLGDRCEINIDDCLSGPCRNAGVCVDGINRYSCNCNDTGYEGEFCETEINECASSPCQNEATCQDLVNDYNCTCNTGYEGKNCQINMDQCASGPCLNGGSCYQNNSTDGNETNNAGFHCACADGYTGMTCDEDIDDCINNPCKFGNCTDQVAFFSCRCDPGYKGQWCDERINVCEEHAPCSNLSTCVEDFPGYSCRCGEGYGGKNCTMELVGCQNVLCGGNSSCIPLLLDEATDAHGHHCECSSGFTGSNCEINTSLTFEEDSFLLVLYKNLSSSFSFKFKTMTPSNVHISSIISSGSLITMVLDNDMCFQVKYLTFVNGQIAEESQRELCSNLPLNSGEWNRVDVELEEHNDSLSLLHVSLNHFGCRDYSCRMGFNSSRTVASQGCLSFGRLRPDVNITTAYNLSSFLDESWSLPPVRCLSEIKLDDVFMTLNDSNVMTSHVTRGCKDACDDTKCQNNGTCLELRDDFVCKCDGIYYGKTCSRVLEPATFGYNFENSYMIFNVSHLFDASDLSDHLKVSFIFRTKSKDGFIFLIQTDDDDDDGAGNDNGRIKLFRCVLSQGSLVVRVEISGVQGPLAIDFNFTQFINGEQHLMELYWDYHILSLYVDRNLTFTTLLDSSNETLTGLSRVYVGGTKDDRIKKRQPTNSDVQNFWGSLQAFYLNDVPFDFTCSGDAPDLGRMASTDECHNVVPGEKTSDVCTFTSPCPIGFECRNLFFNNYDCKCTNKLTGGYCNDGVCKNQACPEGSYCQNVDDDKFECLATASFNSLSYVINFTDEGLRNAYMRFKTKKRMIRLLRVGGLNEGHTCVVFIELNFNLILVKLNDFVVDTVVVDRSDDRWIEFNANFSSNGVNLNSNRTRPPSKNYNNACYEKINLMHVAIARDDFDGCISEMRINNVLLPFFNKDRLKTATSFYDKFIDVQMDNLTLGSCQLGSVCQSNPCQNGGICVNNRFNNYRCRCLPGFDGYHCEICRLKECPRNCSPNSGCVPACGSDCDDSDVLSHRQVVGIIVGTVMGALVLVLISTIIYGIVKVKNKRARQGVYNPSMEEVTGSNVQFNEALKIPTEERLI